MEMNSHERRVYAAMLLRPDGEWLWHDALGLFPTVFARGCRGVGGSGGLAAKGIVEMRRTVVSKVGRPRMEARLLRRDVVPQKTKVARNSTCEEELDLGGENPLRLAGRFWHKVDRNGPNGCWLWLGMKVSAKKRYGRILIAGRLVAAHRVAWVMTNGAVPKGMRVCHDCDNPPCVNPSHLFLGTHQDNMDDMVAKGRAANGARNGRSSKNAPAVIRV